MLLLAACDGEASTSSYDAGARDAGSDVHDLDAALRDAEARDAPTPDAFVVGDGATDAGAVTPDAGFEVASACELVGYDPSAPRSTVYYVDFDAGDDSRSGTTRETAWRTLPGTWTVDGSGLSRRTWGAVDGSHKVAPGTTFILKGGTTYDRTDGGFIWVSRDYYQDASASSPIAFTRDPSWGSGAVTFDATGITAGIALILVQVDGVRFDGVSANGFVIQHSERAGIQFKEKPGSGDAIADVLVANVRFFDNGTTCTVDAECDGGQLDVRRGRNVVVRNVEFAGNHRHLQGVLLGESHKEVLDARVCDSLAHDHDGNLDTDDSGIGFKALNGQVVFERCVSHHNLKGFDLGEQSNDPAQTIRYLVRDSEVYANTWGMNANSGATHGEDMDVFFFNNVIRDNTYVGSNIYGAPMSAYVLHNTFVRNGDSEFGSSHLRLTPNSGDTAPIRYFVYNNLFFHATGGLSLNAVAYYDYATYDVTIDSDYNAWFQAPDAMHAGHDTFAMWSGFPPGDDIELFAFGPDGPGHASGKWYACYGDPETPASAPCVTPPPGGGAGHFHCDGHSRATSGADATLPPFTDYAAGDLSLRAAYGGLDLRTKPWFRAELARDRRGRTRMTWDMGAFEH